MEFVALKLSAFSGWIAGAFGSLLAMYFNRKNIKEMENWERVFVFISGVLLAHYAGGAIVLYFHLDVHSIIADAIKLAVGFFGMAILAEAKIQVPLVITAIRKKFIGE